MDVRGIESAGWRGASVFTVLLRDLIGVRIAAYRFAHHMETPMATCIGQTISLKGKISAAEDIRIAGRVDGEIQLLEHVLTVQATAALTAGVQAKSVIVEGAIRGDIVAAENIALQNTALVVGKIAAPRIAISD